MCSVHFGDPLESLRKNTNLSYISFNILKTATILYSFYTAVGAGCPPCENTTVGLLGDVGLQGPKGSLRVASSDYSQKGGMGPMGQLGDQGWQGYEQIQLFLFSYTYIIP